MTATICPSMHNTIADSFYHSIISGSSKFYYFLGKTVPYDLINGVELVETPLPTYKYELSSRKDIISLKRISAGDVSFIIPRTDWIVNTVYDYYDDNYSPTNPSYTGSISLDESKFYVLTSEFNVYICLDNNYNSNSIIAPTGYSSDSFITSDGYKWKFVLNIPLALRSKFLTASYMPITNSINTSFYNNGALSEITISNGGSGYTPNSDATLTVNSGSNPAHKIRTGNKYSIGFIGTTNFIQFGATSNTVGEVFTAIMDGIEVGVDSGSGTVTALTISVPSSSSDIISGNKYLIDTLENTDFTTIGAESNTIGLLFQAIGNTVDIGTIASETIIIDNQKISPSLITIGQNYIIKVKGSTDFTSIGSLSNTVGTVFVATGVTSGSGKVSAITIDNIVQPTSSIILDKIYTIVTPGTSNFTTLGSSDNNIGTTFTANTSIVKRGNVKLTSFESTISTAIHIIIGHKYEIESIGTTDFRTLGSPNNNIGTIFTATVSGYTTESGTGTVKGYGAILEPHVSNIDGSISKVKIVSGGTGYPLDTTITIHGSRMSSGKFLPNLTAKFNPIINSGVIDYVSIVDPGKNYNIDYTTLTVQSDTGVGALVSAIVEHGQIVDVIIDEPGYGYTSAFIAPAGNNPSDTDAVFSVNTSGGSLNTVQANVELLSVNGAIEYIKVLDSGNNYDAATIRITGDGTNATAIANITNGKIESITIVHPGVNYTYANISISGVGYHNITPTPAVVRAIIGPKYGHGANVLSNLNAKRLMFYSSINSDTIGNFKFSNDYRQYGIIKNPSKFNSRIKANNILESGCYNVSGLFSNGILVSDDIVTNSKNNRFIVVAASDNSLLLHSLDDIAVNIGDILTHNMVSYTVQTMIPPTIDKFSGDILYIDNRTAFYQTIDQTVTLTTVLQF